jgi:hypothetical protein
MTNEIFRDIQCIVRPFCIMLILQNVLNWSLQNEIEILDRTFDIERKRFDKRLLPTLIVFCNWNMLM